MRKFMLAAAALALSTAIAQAATATVTCVPPTQDTGGNTIAWTSFTGVQLVDTTKANPSDIGTVVATFTLPTTAPASGASITLAAPVTPNNPATADAYVIRFVTANGPGQASTPITATIPLAVAKAPTPWTLTFSP